MKGLIIFFSALFFASGIFAQTSVADAYTLLKDNKIKEAHEQILKATLDEQYSNLTDTWFIYGEVMLAIYKSSATEIHSLENDALNKAKNAYLKSKELDAEKKHLTNTVTRLQQISVMFYNEGVHQYNAKEFDNSLSSFESALEINNLPMIMKLDTVLYFNAAKTAEKAQYYEKAIRYYKKLIEFNYKGSEMYRYLAGAYLSIGDKALYFKTLQDGLNNFPEKDIFLLRMIINYYLDNQQYEEATQYIEMALKIEPENASYYYILGNIYERNGAEQKSIDYYSKALEIKPLYFEASYNLGVIYHNKAAKEIDVLNTLTNKTEYETKKNDVYKLFSESAGFYEKALLANPEDQETMKELLFLYERLERPEDMERIKAKMN